MNIILIQCKKLVTCDDLKKKLKRYVTFSNNPPTMRFFQLYLWNKPDLWHPEQSIQTLFQQNRLDPGLQLLLGEFGMKLTDTVYPHGIMTIMTQGGACDSK